MYLKQKIFYIPIGAILLAVFQVGFHLPFALTGVVFASESRAGDKENVVASIEQIWKDIALKNPVAIEGGIPTVRGPPHPRVDCGNFYRTKNSLAGL